MTNVHHLPTQDDMLGDTEPVEIDDTAAIKAAREAFDEAAATGCSFADCLLSVYEAGVSSVLGKPKRARKLRKRGQKVVRYVLTSRGKQRYAWIPGPIITRSTS